MLKVNGRRRVDSSGRALAEAWGRSQVQAKGPLGEYESGIITANPVASHAASALQHGLKLLTALCQSLTTPHWHGCQAAGKGCAVCVHSATTKGCPCARVSGPRSSASLLPLPTVDHAASQSYQSIVLAGRCKRRRLVATYLPVPAERSSWAYQEGPLLVPVP